MHRILVLILHQPHRSPQPKRPHDDITINLTDSEDSEHPSKRPHLTATFIEDDDMSWLKGEIGSLRGEVSRMQREIKSLEKSIVRLSKCTALVLAVVDSTK